MAGYAEQLLAGPPPQRAYGTRALAAPCHCVGGMAEHAFAGAEGKRLAGLVREKGTPGPASAMDSRRKRGGPGALRVSPGWRRASQQEVRGQGASKVLSVHHSATETLSGASRGRASSTLPRASTGKLCPENAARERSRVRTLRQAFLALQAALPTVPPDTKLSKLDVLALATSYIAHLTHTLHQGQPPPGTAPPRGAPSFLHPMKKWPMRARLYAGSWGMDALVMPAASLTAPGSRARQGQERSGPGPAEQPRDTS